MRRLVSTLLLLGAALPASPSIDWGRAFERLAVDELVLELSASYKPQSLAFVGAEVVTLADAHEAILHDQTVLIRDGRIAAVGPRASTKIAAGVEQIDARGRFLFPGLTDAHVHTLMSRGDFLLDLINGVTTVREMDGFPWLLQMREAVRQGRLLAPTLFVAGHILNNSPMGWYATVVSTAEEARDIVHQQKAAGYDYIKVHNMMPLPLYDAIAAAARADHIPLVGHIPQEVSVAHALAMGQLTFEHFKGFYLDSNLTPSPEPWLQEIKGAKVWICPTLVTRLAGASVEETLRIVASPEAQLVSQRERSGWLSAVQQKEERSFASVWALSQPIFKQLLPVTDRFIAGTDSGGGYPNLIRGFALHEELETFESLGMPTPLALRTATLFAASALGDTHGSAIEVGNQADLLLLDSNPLLTVKNLRSPRGVLVRGIWLSPARIDAIRARLRTIYQQTGADTSLDHPSVAQIDSFLERMRVLRQEGWVPNGHQLESLAAALREIGRNDDAARIADWAASAH
jgi:imidazolonepropionase-like amidohydrolase